MNTNNLVESVVTLPGLADEISCWLTEPRTYWNGYDCPLFDRTQLDDLIAAIETAGGSVEENANLHTVIVDMGGDTTEAEEIRTEEGPMWAVGAMGWCWIEDKRASVEVPLLAPRFVWAIGAYRAYFSDIPELAEVTLWDRINGKPVVTLHEPYRQLFCLEAIGDAPLSELAGWANKLTPSMLASEGIK